MANTIKTPDMQELLEAGAHFGHKVSRGNPGMKRYIFGARDGVHIVDLAKTEELLKEAVKGAYEFGKANKTLLIVGTKKQSQQIVRDLAKEGELPFLADCWVGGLYTNFEEIRKNIKKLNDLKVAQTKGELSMYTKKEQLLIARKLQKFDLQLGGVANMEKVPDGIFVIDAVSDNTAVKEANKLGVVVFGICDTNADPAWFNFPVPANDDGIKSIKIISESIIRSYVQGKKEAGSAVTEAPKAEEPKKTAQKEEKIEAKKEEVLDEAIAKEAEALEEEVEKEVLQESERKVE